MTLRADHSLDQHLIAIGQGDHSAFSPLYETLHIHLRRFVKRRVSKEEDAEDIVQVVLTKVFTHASEFDSARGTAIGWMLTIALYEVRTHRRRRQRSREVADEGWSAQLPACDTCSPEDLAILLDLQRATSEVLARLNRRDADLVRGAAFTDTSAPASPLERKRLSRARKRVVQEWTAQHGR